MSKKAKGNRTQRKAIEYLQDQGYLVDKVEKTGKFVSHKDLFSEVCDGFDLIALGDDEVLLVQVKTNKPARQKTYKEFAKKYASKHIKIIVLTWYDNKGFVLQRYLKSGGITKEDMRK